jgi:hypothetical protein
MYAISMNIYMYILFLWVYLKDWVGLILRFMKSVIKSVSLSMETLPLAKKIISRKYNIYVKFRI